MSVAPAFVSSNNTTFFVGLFSSFLVATVGVPPATITYVGTLPPNVTFVDNSDGTGTLSGIPQTGTDGVYALTFTATNIAGTTNQPFTLTVLTAICIHPEMEAETINGDLIKISDVKPGTHLRSIWGSSTKVMINHQNTGPSNRLVKFEVNSLAKNVPSKPLRITPNHPIIIDNKSVRPRSLLNNDTISMRKSNVRTHTIVTDNGLPIMIYNVPVSTWNINKWNQRFSTHVQHDKSNKVLGLL